MSDKVIPESPTVAAEDILNGRVRSFVVYDVEVTAWAGSLSRGWTGEGEFPEVV